MCISLTQNSDVSRDICDNDFDPFPEFDFETHGTSVAGEIISGKSNPFCGTGVAYNAIYGSMHLSMHVIQLALCSMCIEQYTAKGFFLTAWH